MDEKKLESDRNEYVRGGKGRKDEVGPTGIFPASGGEAPEDAETMGQEELGHRSGNETLARAEDVNLAEPRPGASRTEEE